MKSEFKKALGTCLILSATSGVAFASSPVTDVWPENFYCVSTMGSSDMNLTAFKTVDGKYRLAMNQSTPAAERYGFLADEIIVEEQGTLKKQLEAHQGIGSFVATLEEPYYTVTEEIRFDARIDIYLPKDGDVEIKSYGMLCYPSYEF